MSKEIEVRIPITEIQNLDTQAYRQSDTNPSGFVDAVTDDFIRVWWLVGKLKKAGIPVNVTLTGDLAITTGNLSMEFKESLDAYVYRWTA